VATGRNQSREKLLENNPDHLIEDLRDTKKVLEILETL
jgi:hypothetical protein